MRRVFGHGGKGFNHHQPGLRNKINKETIVADGVETHQLIVQIGKMPPYKRNRIHVRTRNDRTDNVAPPCRTAQRKSGKTVRLKHTVTRILRQKSLQNVPARNAKSRPV